MALVLPEPGPSPARREKIGNHADRIFVADSNPDKHEPYRRDLGGIVGRENVIIVDNRADALIELPKERFALYAVDLALNAARGTASGWGLDLAERIRDADGNRTFIALIGAELQLLREAQGRGFKQLYTHTELGSVDGYGTWNDFIRDIDSLINRGK